MAVTHVSMHDKKGLSCNRKLLVPVIEAMHKKLPAGPSNLLLYRYNEVNIVNFDRSEGIAWERLLFCKYKLTRELLRAEIREGMELIKLLLLRSKAISLVNVDISEGIDPPRLFSLRYKW